MNIETIKRLAAEVWPTGVVVMPSDMAFLERFTELVLQQERVPEQFLTFADGSQVTIRDCPLIMQASWEPALTTPRHAPRPPGQEHHEFNKYGVNVTLVNIEARKKADKMIADCYPIERRDTPAARERWNRTYCQTFMAMAQP